MEKRKRLKEVIPETYRKSLMAGSIGAAIGAGIGGYTAVTKGNIIYAGIGGAIGSVVGIIIGLLIGRKVNLKSFITTERIMNFILGITSFFLAMAGIIVFILTKEWVGMIGALFFGVCGIYLLRRSKK
jgi:hypothetical protein